MNRPRTIECACGTVVTVGKSGRIPWRCFKCIKKHQKMKERGEETPTRPKGLDEDVTDERDLGPEKPLHGMSEQEYLEWKKRRIIELYRQDTDLSVEILSERFNVPVNTVYHWVQNVKSTEEQKNQRNRFPYGTPVM